MPRLMYRILWIPALIADIFWEKKEMEALEIETLEQ